MKMSCSFALCPFWVVGSIDRNYVLMSAADPKRTAAASDGIYEIEKYQAF